MSCRCRVAAGACHLYTTYSPVRYTSQVLTKQTAAMRYAAALRAFRCSGRMCAPGPASAHPYRPSHQSYRLRAGAMTVAHGVCPPEQRLALEALHKLWPAGCGRRPRLCSAPAAMKCRTSSGLPAAVGGYDGRARSMPSITKAALEALHKLWPAGCGRRLRLCSAPAAMTCCTSSGLPAAVGGHDGRTRSMPSITKAALGACTSSG